MTSVIAAPAERLQRDRPLQAQRAAAAVTRAPPPMPAPTTTGLQGGQGRRHPSEGLLTWEELAAARGLGVRPPARWERVPTTSRNGQATLGIEDELALGADVPLLRRLPLPEHLPSLDAGRANDIPTEHHGAVGERVVPSGLRPAVAVRDATLAAADKVAVPLVDVLLTCDAAKELTSRNEDSDCDFATSARDAAVMRTGACCAQESMRRWRVSIRRKAACRSVIACAQSLVSTFSPWLSIASRAGWGFLNFEANGSSLIARRSRVDHFPGFTTFSKIASLGWLLSCALKSRVPGPKSGHHDGPGPCECTPPRACAYVVVMPPCLSSVE
eukprot:CAMPEP_0171209842 /NCGR_PEP_ID=MMETSP0790-20130122/28800_1 /TAXON_ID=2925 /ORGANISM="Alexandrium catenella, Strain OF101" /LENGTH=328 /DNA_ID=CAMNT_0011675457 /DNA_START=24 /DNA_END=1013 /DNA_ORIENTATION=+